MRDVVVETVQELTNDRLHDRFFVVFSRERFDRVDRVPNGGEDEPPSRSKQRFPAAASRAISATRTCMGDSSTPP